MASNNRIAERSGLTPPVLSGRGRAFGLAVLVHIALVLALAWGVSWRRSERQIVQAELWSMTPQQAAPAAAQQPRPQPEPERPKPVPAPPPQPSAEQLRAAEIAQKKELERKEEEKRRQQEREKAEKEKVEKEKAEKEKAAKEKAAQEKAAREKAEKERVEKEKAEKEKVEKEKAEKEKVEKERAAKEKAAREKADAEKRRQEQINRMSQMAGSGTDGSGTGARTSGPSSGYAGKIVAAIKPNIRFADSLPADTKTEVEIQVAADGTILSSRIVRSSGVRAWDEAVVRGIELTSKLPYDTDGRIPASVMIIEVTP